MRYQKLNPWERPRTIKVRDLLRRRSEPGTTLNLTHQGSQLIEVAALFKLQRMEKNR